MMSESNGAASREAVDSPDQTEPSDKGWSPTLEELRAMTEKHAADAARAEAEFAAVCRIVATASPDTRMEELARAVQVYTDLDRDGLLDWREALQRLEEAADQCGIPRDEARAMIRSGGETDPRGTVETSPGTEAPPGKTSKRPSDPGTRNGGRNEQESQARAIVRLAKGEELELFHDPSGKTYAAVSVDGHAEVHATSSAGFRMWLKRLYYLREDKVPSSEAFQGALGILEAQAAFDGPERSVHVRVAEHEGRIYLDLCDPAWRAVEIDADGWRIRKAPPVRFRRPSGLLPLPEPAHGGTIDQLKQFVNIMDEDFILMITWLAASLRPTGPYPVLVLTGEQGSAKSTTARLARNLIDPHVSPIRAEPKEVRDLMISAKNSHVVAIDNITSIQPWLSDALCRLATGGGFSTRANYTDSDEVFFDAVRPVILTGISDFVARGDLIDRSLFLRLLVIPESKRKPESRFWSDFDRAAPVLFGALLDAVSGGMRRLPEIELPGLPRMADFAMFGEAVGQAAGNPPGLFIESYDKTLTEANEVVVEDSPVARAVRSLADRGGWKGTVGELLIELERIVGSKTADSKFWPKSAKGLSSSLRRLAPSLRKTGVEVEIGKHTNRGTLVVIRPTIKGGGATVTPSPLVVNPSFSGGLSGDGLLLPTVTRSSPDRHPPVGVGNAVTIDTSAVGQSSPDRHPQPSPHKSLENKGLSAAPTPQGDGVTVPPPTLSGGEFTADGGFRC